VAVLWLVVDVVRALVRVGNYGMVVVVKRVLIVNGVVVVTLNLYLKDVIGTVIINVARAVL
jgi:hypothetical protein